MNKLTWINILHFYQPPTADNETVILAAEKSYKRIIGALKRNPRIKFTLNFTGCLLEKLDRLGYGRLINNVKSLYLKKQIELTVSAAFHPILPLLERREIERNLEIDRQILKKYFGRDFRAAGFFPPELAYDRLSGKVIKQSGSSWVALDEISANGRLKAVDFNKLYLDKLTGLNICFRSRELSKSYVPKNIFKLISEKKSGPVITATDAELYGLRHSDQTATFEKLLKRPEITTLTVSQFLSGLKEKTVVSPLAASWETTPAEIKSGRAFALWQNPGNKIQTLLWQLAELAIAMVEKNRADANYNWARFHLDRGLSSCTFWWASARDFKLFGAISWSPDEIERGLNELVKSIRALNNLKTKPAKIAAEKLYLKIKQQIWHKHWYCHWGK